MAIWASISNVCDRRLGWSDDGGRDDSYGRVSALSGRTARYHGRIRHDRNADEQHGRRKARGPISERFKELRTALISAAVTGKIDVRDEEPRGPTSSGR